MSRKPLCMNCIYYKNNRDNYGVCIRHAPSASLDEQFARYAVWPIVNEDKDWCGDMVYSVKAKRSQNC